MGDVLAERPRLILRRRAAVSHSGRRLALRSVRKLRWLVWIGVAGLTGWGAILEANSGFVQSQVFSQWAKTMTFAPANGTSAEAHFPQDGPYDERLGYTKLPSYIARLAEHGYTVERQAVPSPALAWFATHGGNPPYQEKNQAGLTLYDRTGAPLRTVRYPTATYRDFADIPPLVVETLLFIEDRFLLGHGDVHRNPAIEWKRFLLAATGRIGATIDPRLRRGGASTLATQIEKFRHSPAGRTDGIFDKFRQMLSATLRAYRDGPETLEARQHLVVTYLNATPLASRPGHGEIIGVGDALRAWFGTDLAEANRVLNAPAATPDALARKAEIYRQVLSLLLAERRPTYYLRTNRAALDVLTDRYLGLLAGAGIIDAQLYDATLTAMPHILSEPPPPIFPASDRAANVLRTELLNLLSVPSFYALDRLDLTAHSTIDASAQRRVTDILARLNDSDFVNSHHLVGSHLLHTTRNLKVNYSIVLYERGADRNHVRVHADNLNAPFDVNAGAKLILGSTAKLRTLVTYLNIISALHSRYADRPKAELTARTEAHDPLTRWAMTWLANTPDRGLQRMLDAAMQRRYSASPGQQFFTGGGTHVFHNFESREDSMQPTVEAAFVNSINLVFIRMMRDITQYFTAQNEEGSRILADPHDEVRQAYLRRFADAEGRKFISRFYKEYRARGPGAELALIARRGRSGLDRRAALFRSVRPEASPVELRAFLAAHSPAFNLSEEALAKLYAKYGPGQFSLADRAYLSGVHPLEIWVASYLIDHPDATRSEVLEQSASVRQEAYDWLFRTRSLHKQDVRLRILLEEDAFDQILQDWQEQGYPFSSLVPSLATAIGSSGDRPDALAQLVGIILNEGVHKPTVNLNRLEFAVGTPYQTEVGFHAGTPERVMAPEVAATIRAALSGVVRSGTGKGLQGTYFTADGQAMLAGGKTGTGDNRFQTSARGGGPIASRAVDRTATLVFFLGDRFFGTVTAYVAGPEADRYHFTSALAVRVLKALEPALRPLINATQGTATSHQ
jgi:membrane peptidoglycan carboxypeptidase